ncbi:hypothetical protein D9M68_831980 [compost metagenome]
MRLKAQRRAVAIGQPGIGGEFGRQDHLGIGRWHDDLILMRAGHGQGGGRGLHIGRARFDGVVVPAKAPALFGFPHIATQRIGHDLVAKAHAEHRGLLGIGIADEGAQRIEPGEVVIDASGGAGDQHGFKRRRIGQRLAIGHRHHVIGETGSGGIEHGLKHLAIRPEARPQRQRNFAGL